MSQSMPACGGGPEQHGAGSNFFDPEEKQEEKQEVKFARTMHGLQVHCCPRAPRQRFSRKVQAGDGVSGLMSVTSYTLLGLEGLRGQLLNPGASADPVGYKQLGLEGLRAGNASVLGHRRLCQRILGASS